MSGSTAVSLPPDAVARSGAPCLPGTTPALEMAGIGSSITTAMIETIIMTVMAISPPQPHKRGLEGSQRVNNKRCDTGLLQRLCNTTSFSSQAQPRGRTEVTRALMILFCCSQGWLVYVDLGVALGFCLHHHVFRNKCEGHGSSSAIGAGVVPDGHGRGPELR